MRNDARLTIHPELKDIVMEGCLNLLVCETTVLDECYAANLAWKEQGM